MTPGRTLVPVTTNAAYGPAVDERPELIGELDEPLARLADVHEPEPRGLELGLLVLGEGAEDQAVAGQHQTASHVVHRQHDALRESSEFIHGSSLREASSEPETALRQTGENHPTEGGALRRGQAWDARAASAAADIASIGAGCPVHSSIASAA